MCVHVCVLHSDAHIHIHTLLVDPVSLQRLLMINESCIRNLSPRQQGVITVVFFRLSPDWFPGVASQVPPFVSSCVRRCPASFPIRTGLFCPGGFPASHRELSVRVRVRVSPVAAPKISSLK